MKISKQQAEAHKRALDLINSDRTLSLDERWYVIEHYNEAAQHMNGLAGAFFTPLGLCYDTCLGLTGRGRMLDLCAGIGRLSFVARHRWFGEACPEQVCVEINPDYVKVGKRVLPSATWVCGDATDEGLIRSLGRFSDVISNPPFGNIKGSGSAGWAGYTGSAFDLKMVAVAGEVADWGTFILPENSTPFRYSRHSQRGGQVIEGKLAAFMQQTGIEMDLCVGIDTSFYVDEWGGGLGKGPAVEVVHVDYSERGNLNRENK